MICVHCGSTIDDGVRSCPICGCEVIKEEQELTSGNLPLHDSQDSIYGPMPFYTQAAANPTPSNAKPARGKKPVIILIAAIACVALLISSVFLILYFKENTSNKLSGPEMETNAIQQDETTIQRDVTITPSVTTQALTTQPFTVPPTDNPLVDNDVVQQLSCSQYYRVNTQVNPLRVREGPGTAYKQVEVSGQLEKAYKGNSVYAFEIAYLKNGDIWVHVAADANLKDKMGTRYGNPGWICLYLKSNNTYYLVATN